MTVWKDRQLSQVAELVDARETSPGVCPRPQ